MGKTIFSLLERRIQDTPYRVYLKYRQDAINWTDTTWKEYGNRIDSISKALIKCGIKRGSKVSIIGPSSPKWFMVDMSVMTIGAVIAPIYVSSSAEQIVYIVNHSEAEVLFIENPDYLQRIANVLDTMPILKSIVLLNGTYAKADGKILDLESFEKLGTSITTSQLNEVRKEVKESDIATYIYTSGTTGPPKAVMLSQKNYYAAAQNWARWMDFLVADKSVRQIKDICFLTLAHVYERISSLIAPLLTGAVIYFAKLENALEELKEIQPHFLVALPRTWEKMHEAVMANREQMPGKKQKIFDWAIEIGRQYNTLIYGNKAVPLKLRFKYWVARKLVIDKIKDSLGCFKAAKHLMTGGAVSSKEVIDFFFSLGLWICQVYGQSEALGLGSAENRECLKFGSVGKPFPCTSIAIADDGEIMVKSDTVSPGYYKEPELNRETFKDGWLYSGDLGYIDEEGCLFITGRKKDIIITSGAKNITPSKIEASLMSSPLIEHAVIAGDGKKFLTALLTLSLDGCDAFAKARGMTVKSYADLFQIEEIKFEVDKHVQTINTKYSRVEQIKKFAILARPLSIESGELTSLLKIKRYKVIQNHESEIEKMYQADTRN